MLKTLPGILALLSFTACSSSSPEGRLSAEAAQTERTPQVNRRCESGVQENDRSAGQDVGVFTLKLGKGESAKIAAYFSQGTDYRKEARIADVVGSGVTSIPENTNVLFIEAPGDTEYQFTTESVIDPTTPPRIFFEVECFTACKTDGDCTQHRDGSRSRCEKTVTRAIGATKNPMTCEKLDPCKDGLDMEENCDDGSVCGCGLSCQSRRCQPIPATHSF